MARNELREYINQRYERWLEYAFVKCNETGLSGQEGDVLNYVLLDILENKVEKADALFREKIKHRTRKGRLTEEIITKLDLYVLASIRNSCIYPTSSYRLRNDVTPSDKNVKPDGLKLYDEEYNQEEADKVQDERELELLIIRNVVDSLYLSDLAKRVFQFRFVEGRSYKEWPGSESSDKLRKIYYHVTDMIRNVMNNNEPNLFTK